MAKRKSAEELEEKVVEATNEENGEAVKVEESEAVDEETSLAADTLKPASRSVNDPKSKLEMIQRIVGAVSGMSHQDLTHFFKAAMDQFGPNKDWGVGDVAGKNAASISMKPSAATVKEDLTAMFQGQDLSEEFKENAATLFEAAVSARIMLETARLEEEFENKIQEEIKNILEEVSTKVDTYLDFTAEKWLEENTVAIESALQTELTNGFIEGLKNLFAEHYIQVPSDKVDVLEAMAEKVSALETKLDETISENAELRGVIINEAAKQIFADLASDLALTQQEKFAKLAEGVEFDNDLEVFEKKLKVIKENYFKPEIAASSNIEEETFEGDTDTKPQTQSVEPTINRYVQAIARTVKN